MKNARPSRPKGPMRLPILATMITAVALAAWPAPARAADDTHWLTPSRRAVDKGTFFEAGLPAHESGAAPARSSLVRAGAVLYGVHCSTCHGAGLQGTPGVPSLLRSGGAAVDFYLTTGRMPLALRTRVQAFHVPSLFDARQTAALEAYVDAHAQQHTPIPNVRVAASKLQQGRRIFENDCQACHGAAAQGATAGRGWIALPLDAATPTQIGEAIRIGPGVMPRFTQAQLSGEEVDAVATYVRYLAGNSQSYGGAVMQYLGPISEGAVSAIVGVGFLFWVIYFTGTKADGRRLNELD